MPSPSTIIRNVAVDLNLAASPESLGPNIYALLLSHYNRMVNLLAIDPKFGWYMRNEVFTFPSSAQSYTFGPTGVIVATGLRPPFIDRAKLVMVAGSPDSEINLPVITVQLYQNLPVPAQSGQPSKLYYQPTVPNGTLFTHPYPTDLTNTLRLFWRNQLAEVTNANSTVNIDLPQAYEDMLTTKLSIRIASIPRFNLQVSDDMRMMARAAEQAVTGLNNSDPALISTALLGQNRRNPGGNETWFNTLGGI